jgi:hypothetical protein
MVALDGNTGLGSRELQLYKHDTKVVYACGALQERTF